MNKFLILSIVICIGGLVLFGYIGQRANASNMYGIVSKQGKRDDMEDRYCIVTDHDMKLYGIFDGHDGAWVADKLSSDLAPWLFEALKKISGLQEANTLDKKLINTIQIQLKEGYMAFDKHLWSTAKIGKLYRGGSTAIVVLEVKDHWFFINLGDSRALYSCEGNVILATEDQKTGTQKEKERIEQAGGQIVYHAQDVPRVLGFAVSRSFGNHFTGQKIRNNTYAPGILCAEPEIIAIQKSAKKGYIVLGSDGLWDVMSSQEVAKYVTKLSNQQPDRICQKIFEEAYQRGSADNITIMVIKTL